MRLGNLQFSANQKTIDKVAIKTAQTSKIHKGLRIYNQAGVRAERDYANHSFPFTHKIVKIWIQAARKYQANLRNIVTVYNMRFYSRCHQKQRLFVTNFQISFKDAPSTERNKIENRTAVQSIVVANQISLLLQLQTKVCCLCSKPILQP